MSRIAVLGSRGTLGSLVVPRLRAAGHDVCPVSRRDGVDVVAGTGLSVALEGVEVVLDCLNDAATKPSETVAFFTTAADRVVAALPPGASLVLVSILNVTDPGVARLSGHYAGKAAQERAYRDRLGDRLTVVSSAQWFELGELFCQTFRRGRLALVPALRCQPVAAAAVADRLVPIVAAPDGGRHQIAGPEPRTTVELAAAWSRTHGLGLRVISVPLPLAAARRGMLPRGATDVDPTTLAEWERARTGPLG